MNLNENKIILRAFMKSIISSGTYPPINGSSKYNCIMFIKLNKLCKDAELTQKLSMLIKNATPRIQNAIIGMLSINAVYCISTHLEPSNEYPLGH